MDYVMGLMFSKDREEVLTLLKDRPEWQKGKLNGPGGKIERTDATPATAMAREFEEETGIETSPDDWEEFCVLQGDNSKIHCFRCFNDDLKKAKQLESEKPIVVNTWAIPRYNTVPNLKFLIPMAKFTKEHFVIQAKIRGGTNHG